MADVEDDDRRSPLLVAGETNRVPPRTSGSQLGGEVGADDQGVAVGIREVQPSGGRLVDVAGRIEISPVLKVKTKFRHAYFTRPWVGSPIASCLNPVRKEGPTKVSESL